MKSSNGGRDVRTNHIVDLSVDIARETRQHADLKLGSSVRGSIDMVEIYMKTMEVLTLTPRDTSAGEEMLFKAALMAFRNKIWLYENKRENGGRGDHGDRSTAEKAKKKSQSE